jgi:hypothetical protein
MNIFNKIAEFFSNLFNSKKSLENHVKKFIHHLDNDLTDNFLELLFKLFSLVLLLDKKFRRNIENFDARYTFRSMDDKISASVIFAGGKMKIINKDINNTNVTVVFKDGRTLREFLFADNPDIFSFIIDNKLYYIGNLNYLLKFAYMANHLKLAFKLPKSPNQKCL